MITSSRRPSRVSGNLKLDFVDIQQFHVWNDNWANDAEWSDAISKLKEEGKIRHFESPSTTISPKMLLPWKRPERSDTFQSSYNLFDQCRKTTAPILSRKKHRVIVRVPLDEGGLSGSITTVYSISRWGFSEQLLQGGPERSRFIDRVTQTDAKAGGS